MNSGETEPRFAIGQTVYNRANSIKGEVRKRFRWSSGRYTYEVWEDLGGDNFNIHDIGESGLCASLEEKRIWMRDVLPGLQRHLRAEGFIEDLPQNS